MERIVPRKIINNRDLIYSMSFFRNLYNFTDEEADFWYAAEEPEGRPIIPMVRVPKGHSLEKILQCSTKDLKKAGLTEKFKTNHGTTIYKFR